MSSIYDGYPSTLSAIQLTVTAQMLQNKGLRPSPSITSALASYTGLPLISTYVNMQTQANAGTGGITAANANYLKIIGAATFPAAGDSIPQYYINLGTFANVNYPPGFAGIISTKVNLYMGSPTGTSNNWDLSRAAQIIAACISYSQLANQFIISACNSDTYLCDTFTNTDNMTTGDITAVSLATDAFGTDLANLGNLIDLANLDDMGSPLALIRQIINSVGTIPVISLTFVAAGVPNEVVIQLDNPNASVTDSAQRAMYQAMTQITGDSLAQILQVMGVKTVGITTMADLLNPQKLFPNSFATLTVKTANGPRAIYSNTTGSVNTNLLKELPNYIISSTAANGPQTQPNSGTSPIDWGPIVQALKP